jgi:hypothetical protein
MTVHTHRLPGAFALTSLVLTLAGCQQAPPAAAPASTTVVDVHRDDRRPPDRDHPVPDRDRPRPDDRRPDDRRP